MKKSKVIKHLKGDIKTFKKEAQDDRELIKALYEKPKKSVKKTKKRTKKATKKRIERPGKIAIVMEEFKKGKLHSGSKHGPKVRKRKQAIAIALKEAKN